MTREFSHSRILRLNAVGLLKAGAEEASYDRCTSRRDGWHEPISSMLILMGADNHYRTVGVAHDLLGIRSE